MTNLPILSNDGEANLVERPPEARRSPFIPRAIDNTALDAFMACPRRFLYSMILNRRGRVGSAGLLSPALAYGTTWHAIMEAHYKTGGDIKSVTDAAVASWKPHANPEDHRTLERCVTEYGKFLNHFGTHDTEVKGWGTTVGYPDSPIVEFPAEIWWPGAVHPYTGKIDRIFQHAGLYYVEDHKTTSALGPFFFQQFDPSNQMMGYAVLAQQLSGLPIAGVRINAHACLKASSKFERQVIMFSPERLAEWAENLNAWFLKLEAAWAVWDTYKDLNHPEVLKHFPFNFNACAGKYGPCTYVGVDTYPAQIRGRILEAEFEVVPWNPLNPDGDGE